MQIIEGLNTRGLRVLFWDLSEVLIKGLGLGLRITAVGLGGDMVVLCYFDLLWLTQVHGSFGM